MSKDKKKKNKQAIPTGPGIWAGESGKKRVWRPELTYCKKDIVNLAETIISINPYMKDKCVDSMVMDIIQSITRAFQNNYSFVSTAGWFARFDEWEDITFVDLYVDADMAHKKTVMKGHKGERV